MIYIISAKAVFIAIAKRTGDDEFEFLQGSVLRQQSAGSLDGNPV